MMRKLLFLFSFILGLSSVFAQNLPVIEFNAAKGAGIPGDTVCIPFTVSNFQEVQGMQWSVYYNFSALELVEFIPGDLPSFNSSNINVNLPGGIVPLVWFAPGPDYVASLPDSTVLFELCFQISQTAVTGFAHVGFTERFTTTEVFLDEGKYDNPFSPTRFTSGGIQINKAGELSVDGNIDISSACGISSHTLTTSVSGGTPPYTYSWTKDGAALPDSTHEIQNASEGLYQLIVSDQDSRFSVATFNVELLNKEASRTNQLDLPRIDATINCFLDTVEIGVIEPEGTDYVYQWNTLADSPTILTDDPNSSYSLTVTNQDGTCSQVLEFYVPLEKHEFQFERIEGINQCGAPAPEIGVRTPDSLNYGFIWLSGERTPTVVRREEGPHTLQLSYGTFCVQDVAFYVEESLNLSVDVQTEIIDCGKTSATASVVAAAELGTLSYQWSNGSTAATTEFTRPGTYSVEITYPGGCVEVREFQIEADFNTIPVTPLETVTACTPEDVEVGVLPTDSTANIQYNWENGATTPTIMAGPGEHRLTVSTALGCSDTYAFTVSSNGANFPVETTSQEINLSCTQSSTEIGLRNYNPSDSLTFEWSTGANSPTINAAPGTYFLNLIAPNGCLETLNFNLQGFQPGTIDVKVECEENSCQPGEPLVTLSSEVEKGPLVLEWSTGQTDTVELPFTTTLPVNTEQFWLLATDTTGCTDTIPTYFVECQTTHLQRDDIRLYLSCEEDSLTGNSAATITAEILSPRGVPPFYFEWSNGVKDTSWFNSTLPYSDFTDSIFVQVSDSGGGPAIYNDLISDPTLYGCGTDSTHITYQAPHQIVAPGQQFIYPVYVYNYENTKRSVFTVDWDPCLLQADSILSYASDGSSYVYHSAPEGTYEAFFGLTENGPALPDTFKVMDIFFTAEQMNSGVSPFLFSINEVGQGTEGQLIYLRPEHGSITVAEADELILPGDTDENGAVNHFDLLNLGLNFGNQGPDRRSRSRSALEYAYPWIAPAYNSSNLKHVDCNGDGLISAADTNIINLNWDLSNSTTPRSKREGLTLQIIPDSIAPGIRQQLPIELLNSSQLQAENYGIAFSIRYPLDMVEPGSIRFRAAESSLGAESELLQLQGVDTERGLLHLALSRTDGQGVPVNGLLGQLELIATAEAVTGIPLQIQQVLLVDPQGQDIPVSGMETEVPLKTATAVNDPLLSAKIEVYPNPVQNVLHIQNKGLHITEVRVINKNGQLQTRSSGNNDFVNVQQLPAGLYLVQIICQEGLVVKKWIKQ